jgi:hypothetical protein
MPERPKMKNPPPISVQALTDIQCDRCGLTATDHDREFYEFRSIDFVGGYDSLFGDGAQVAIDLCQHCLLSQLGKWLRTPFVTPTSERKNYQSNSYADSMWAALSGYWRQLHEVQDDVLSGNLQRAKEILAQWACSSHEVNLLLPDYDRCETISSMARCELMVRAGRYTYIAEKLNSLSLARPATPASWLRRPSSHPICLGQSALQVMLRGGLEDVFAIENILNSATESPAA